MSVKTPLKLEGIITIRLIDKKSGKTVYEKKVKNAVLSPLAQHICGTLAGDNNYPLVPISLVSLFDAGDNPIKDLSPPTTLEHRGYSDHWDVHAVFRDTSSDEYTVARVDLVASGTVGEGTYTYNIARQRNLNVAKTADQVLVVDWVINVPFQAA